MKTPYPPKYSGVREGPKILEWTHQASTYLRAVGLEHEERGVWHITAFLDGDAAVWWRLHCDKMRRGVATTIQTWDQLREMLLEQFEVFNHATDVRDRYQAVRQTSTVSAYITKFRSLVVELPNEPEENQIYQFLKGLKPEIQARTRTHKPNTLTTAMDIADEADRANYHAYGGGFRMPRREVGGSVRAASATGPAPMDIGAIGSADAQRLRQENRCFYCRKTGHQSRECQKRRRDERGRAARSANQSSRASQKIRRKAENF